MTVTLTLYPLRETADKHVAAAVDQGNFYGQTRSSPDQVQSRPGPVQSSPGPVQVSPVQTRSSPVQVSGLQSSLMIRSTLKYSFTPNTTDIIKPEPEQQNQNQEGQVFYLKMNNQ